MKTKTWQELKDTRLSPAKQSEIMDRAQEIAAKERKERFEHSCQELRLYAENTGKLNPTVRMLVGKLSRTVGSDEMRVAEVLAEWKYLLELAASMYRREIGNGADTDTSFTSDVIRCVAREWASDYLKRLNFGEDGLYD